MKFNFQNSLKILPNEERKSNLESINEKNDPEKLFDETIHIFQPLNSPDDTLHNINKLMEDNQTTHKPFLSRDMSDISKLTLFKNRVQLQIG